MEDQLGLCAVEAVDVEFLSTQRMQALKDGLARAQTDPHSEPLCPTLNGFFRQLSHRPGIQADNVFIKILLFNGRFSLAEQEVTKLHILVSDPG